MYLKKKMAEKVVVTLGKDGSVLIPCSSCSHENLIVKKNLYNSTFCCVSCNELFESPFGRLPVYIATVQDDWDMLVDESWDVC